MIDDIQMQRNLYCNFIKKYDYKNMIFMDEVHFNSLNGKRLYGYFEKGKDPNIVQDTIKKEGDCLSFIVAIDYQGIFILI